MTLFGPHVNWGRRSQRPWISQLNQFCDSRSAKYIHLRWHFPVGDGSIPCLLPHIRCYGLWSWALYSSPARWVPWYETFFLHYSRDSSLLLGSIHPPGETISRQLRCTQVMLHPVISLTSDIISTAWLWDCTSVANILCGGREKGVYSHLSYLCSTLFSCLKWTC